MANTIRTRSDWEGIRQQVIADRWNAMRTNTLSADVSIAENQLLRALDRWSQESGISVTSRSPSCTGSTV